MIEIDEKILNGIKNQPSWQEIGKMYRMRVKQGRDVYMSDFIGEEYLHWCKGSFICMIADTGCGKNHFIEKKLIPSAIQNRKKVLIVSNRIANNRQIKRNLIESIGNPKDLIRYTDIGIDSLKNICTGIDVVSYQELAYEFVSLPNRVYSYDFIFCDEIHWVVEDSQFNSTTDLVLWGIIKKFANATRIYATATPDVVIAEIIRREYASYRFDCYPVSRIPCIYEIRKSYTFVKNCYMIEQYAELFETIKSSNESWLIFVDSLEKGKELHSILEKNEVECSFVHSLSKQCSSTNEEDLSYLLKNRKFRGKCLITTIALDNGISIMDKNLQNIVLYCSPKTTFLQMLGRKRIMDENDFFNLYVMQPNYKKVSGIVQNIFTTYQNIQPFICGNKAISDLYVNGQMKNVFAQSMFYALRQHLRLNEIAYLALLKNLSFWYEIYENIEENKTIYYQYVIRWIGHEIDSEYDIFLKQKRENALNKLESFLNSIEGKDIDKEGVVIFQNTLQELSINAFGDLYKNKSFGTSNVRKLLHEHELPFILETKPNKVWVFKRLKTD